MSEVGLEKKDDDQQRDDDQEALRKACLSVLGAQFDAVQIIASRHDAEDGTMSASWGEGNYWARVGATRSWLKAQDKD